MFAREGFVAADITLGTSQINGHITVFHTFDDTVDDFGNTVFVFFELTLALCFADFLHNDLTRGLRSNAAKIQRRQRFDDELADFNVRMRNKSVFQENLGAFAFHFGIIFDDLLITEQFDIAVLTVNGHANVEFMAVFGTSCLLNGLFHCGQNNFLLNAFFTRNGVCNL